MSVTHFILPDLFSLSTAFRDATNPHWKRASVESRKWVNSYNVFNDHRRAFFIQGQSELLVSHVFPYAGYEEFRTCCDFVHLLFIVDELSDEQSSVEARSTGEVFLNSMRDPSWDDGSKLAHMTKEYVCFPLVLALHLTVKGWRVIASVHGWCARPSQGLSAVC